MNVARPPESVRAAARRLAPTSATRRVWLRAAGAALLGTPLVAAAAADPASDDHFPFGAVRPPRPVPAYPLALHDGGSSDLAALLRGRVSALQLMFTGCSSTCPIQGAVFAQVQGLLATGAPAGVQLLSITIDPLGDTPAALAAWLRKLSAGAGWRAAVPQPNDVARIVALLGDGGQPRLSSSDPHTGQVYVIDRQARLAFRTPSLATPRQIVDALRGVAAAA